jgi:DNA-binding CsgD family transcriptional regulator
MNELINSRRRIWALIAIIGGFVFYLGLEIHSEPDMSALDLALELLELVPIVLTGVGIVYLFELTRRQHDEQLSLIRDLELARIQGQHWRAEARSLIDGLGEAIEAQFSRWNFSEAEREVALLLLKGLSLKEIAAIRATGERTVRAQARSLYGKAKLTGRVGLSAYFLEDLLAPTAEVESSRKTKVTRISGTA